jgi:hypothetical protein
VEFKVMKRLLGVFFCVTLAMASTGCFSQPNDAKEIKTAAAPAVDISVIKQFSHLLAKKEKDSFTNLFPPTGLKVYRGFSSGNLGGRGESISSTFTAKDVKQNLTIDIEGQTPIDFPWLFPGLIEQDGSELPTYPVAGDVVDLENPSKTLAGLQALLTGKGEMVEGAPLLLAARGNKYVLVEAQIIDDALVGGFAIFQEGRLIGIWDVR